MKKFGLVTVVMLVLPTLCRAEQTVTTTIAADTGVRDASNTYGSNPPIRLMENLGRGVVAVRSASNQAFISWRLLGTDPDDIAFNLYRQIGSGSAVRLNSQPLTGGTNYQDTGITFTQPISYFVCPVLDGQEMAASAAFTLAANIAVQPCVVVPLSGGDTDQIHFVWVGDLTGDGEYDFVVDRLNWQGRPQKLEAFTRDGTRLWVVNLGPNSTNTYNIEPGSATIDVGHWDGVTVYDLDCDGKAEVVIRTANGVTFGDGNTLVHPNNNVQFISVLDGMTGAERARIQIPTDYIADGPMAAQMGIGYLNGRTPSIIASMKNRIGSGAFNMMICAWDFDGLSLTQKWQWRRSGNYPDGHNIRIVDVTGDGRDEVGHIGFMLKGDGTVLYNLANTGGVVHGDRWHVGKFDPDRPGLQGYGIQQDNPSGLLEYYYDAATGAMLWQRIGTPADLGRGDVGDVDPRTPGFECWAFNGIWNLPTHTRLSTASPWPVLRLWWNGDDLSESYNDGKIEKWMYSSSSVARLVTTWHYEGATGSDRGAPMFYGDIFGDWREEVVMTNPNYTKLVIFTTDVPTSRRLYTLPHNPAYRNCMTVKGYMQSHHLDYYLGHGMTTPPRPNIELVDVDDTPPWPNPMVWAVEPYESAPGEITMVAATAVDDGESEVQYYFQCVTGGGHDSGWQNNPAYTDTLVTQAVNSYRVKARDTSSNFNETEWSEDVTVTIAPYPYGGQVRSIPDTIQAEHFDVGGLNITYYDTTAGNSGGALRPYEDVDIVAITDGQAGYAIADIQTGEWLIYTVNSSAAQTDFYARVASIQSGGQIRVWLDDVLMATVDVPNTGSLTMWQTVSASSLLLPERENASLKLEFVGTGFRLNWFQFGSQMPYLGAPSAVPGRFEFEDFDIGGQFISYYDKTPTNAYNRYRLDEAVDIMLVNDGGTAYAVYAEATEWLEYTCDIEAAGNYTVIVRSGSSRPVQQQLTMSIDGQTLATFTLPPTGGWSNFENTAVSDVSLPGGERVIRFTQSVSDSNLNWVEFVRQYNSADITQSGRVDMDDFAVLAAQWMGAPGVPSADIAPPGGDGLVDMQDLYLLSENWLYFEMN